MSTDGGPAFPLHPGAGEPGDATWASMQGMALRDWFAGMALAVTIENYAGPPGVGGAGLERALRSAAAAGDGTREEIIARQAYRYADALLAERQRRG